MHTYHTIWAFSDCGQRTFGAWAKHSQSLSSFMRIIRRKQSACLDSAKLNGQGASSMWSAPIMHTYHTIWAFSDCGLRTYGAWAKHSQTMNSYMRIVRCKQSTCSDPAKSNGQGATSMWSAPIMHTYHTIWAFSDRGQRTSGAWAKHSQTLNSYMSIVPCKQSACWDPTKLNGQGASSMWSAPIMHHRNYFLMEFGAHYA